MLALRKASLAETLPAGCGGYLDELPEVPAVGGDDADRLPDLGGWPQDLPSLTLVEVPAVGGDDSDRLPDLGGWPRDLPSIDEGLSNALPAIDALLVGSDDVDDLPTIDLVGPGSGEVVPGVDDSGGDLPVLELANGEVSGVNKLPAVGGFDRSIHSPAVETLVSHAAAGNLETMAYPIVSPLTLVRSPAAKVARTSASTRQRMCHSIASNSWQVRTYHGGSYHIYEPTHCVIFLQWLVFTG